MTTLQPVPEPRRAAFLGGVFLITFAVLVLQVVQTRILSVIAWYFLAFFAISVAMLGLTIGAVWVYLNRASLSPETLSTRLSDASLVAAVAMPASMLVQFSLITSLTPTLTSIVAWALLMAAMTVPYVFAGIVVSLALTRSPFPVSQVYGVDLMGAALGCAAVPIVLNVLDGPSAIVLAGMLAGLAAYAFARAATSVERTVLGSRARWRRPLTAVAMLASLMPLHVVLPGGLKPVLVKNQAERQWLTRTERWNSYSRVIAYQPRTAPPFLWARSPRLTSAVSVRQAQLNIDGEAGTTMPSFDGRPESIDYLRYDLVNLAYHLPGISRAAVIGVGGGRDLLAAHLFGVTDITGIEINRIFIDLHTTHPVYAPLSNLSAIPGLRLYVDDARSWFAATRESFDLIQMSMIDTWAATGAGAFSLSENGLYTLEGWRAFLGRLTDGGVFTVSRWYSPGDVNESGRMVALALAAVIDRGARAPRQHVFVANADRIATLVLSKSPLTPERINLLRDETQRLGFKVLVAPDIEPASVPLRRMMNAGTIDALNAAATTETLDLSVPTDNRPFFFNQLRFRDIPAITVRMFRDHLDAGVLRGNLLASIALVLILAISLIAVVCTIVIPLRSTVTSGPRRLIAAGTLYFSLIGIGFMFAEISLLQFFGVFLGHPIYAMGVCLFSLILSTGLGSFASGRFPLEGSTRFAAWGALVGGYLLVAQWGLAPLFGAASAQSLAVRIGICLTVVMPVGFLMGFAFPTGMKLVERVSLEPTPWFWGINGATGVLASVLAVMIGMALGINVTMFLSGLCYLALIPAARALLTLQPTGT
jgi:spermidine synthase